jgi:hypothetical protein
MMMIFLNFFSRHCAGGSDRQTAHGFPELSMEAKEEAVVKLERLGYKRAEILRQLRDEHSHLYKLYTRFLKAMSVWRRGTETVTTNTGIH